MTEIFINLPSPSEPYSIVIDPGLLARVGKHVRAVARHSRCLLVMDAHVASPHAPHAEIVRTSLLEAGYAVAMSPLVADEKLKTLETVESLYRVMVAAKLERRSPVVALGGGIVGDVAGFAAATYLRGVPLVHVPTTLLAMVDSSIGGKTGVNFPLPASQGDGNALGKNLIGAFWQPKVVLVDPSTLRTLAPRDRRCGLAECIKHALIADAALLRWIDDRHAAIASLDESTVAELIRCCAEIKAAIVAEDERESGRRALLNLGHTFGHAIESISELDVPHGEAVAIGLRAAMHVAVETRRMTLHEQHTAMEVLSRCGLPTRLSAPVALDRLLGAMAFDKKATDGRVRLVLPRGIGAAEVADDVPAALVREAWLDIGAVA